MFSRLVASVLMLALTGCFTERDASYAPGGTKTIVPGAVNLWQAPVLVSNHRYYDSNSGIYFDIEITRIDERKFPGDGQRTKLYYQIAPGPHVIAVSCRLANVTWVATFDFVLDPGDSAEITGELTENGPVLWFAEVKTGRPLTEKIPAVAEPKPAEPPPAAGRKKT
jgi:hypothetical protein